MKSEQEFLSSMWSEINTREWEAKQKLITYDLNKRLFIREVFAYGIIMALLFTGGLIAFMIKDNPNVVYAVAVLLISTAFFTERMFCSKLQEVIIDENRNYY